MNENQQNTKWSNLTMMSGMRTGTNNAKCPNIWEMEPSISQITLSIRLLGLICYNFLATVPTQNKRTGPRDDLASVVSVKNLHRNVSWWISFENLYHITKLRLRKFCRSICSVSWKRIFRRRVSNNFIQRRDWVPRLISGTRGYGRVSLRIRP